MTFRYNPFTRTLKRAYRKFFPVPRSPWTAGHVEDICSVNLVPPEKLVRFFSNCIATLRPLRNNNVGDYLEFGVFNGNSVGSMHIAREAAAVES